MTGLLALAAVGFFLGLRHATDPDHVIAVTTIVARHRSPRSALLIGLVWGVGHSLTILIVGSAILLLGWVIPPRVGLSMEFGVGLMLIVLGLMNLGGVLRRIRAAIMPTKSARVHVHSHAHSHGDYVHTHAHGHDPESHAHRPDETPLGWLDKHLGGLSLYQLGRPLVVGVVHGLAGSAAVALLVLTTIRNPRWSVFYLVDFGLGTIAGMMVMTAAIAMPFALTDRRFVEFSGGLRVASGLMSLAFGLALAYRIGFVDGLFIGSPHWTPH